MTRFRDTGNRRQGMETKIGSRAADQIQLANRLGHLGRLSGRTAPAQCAATLYLISDRRDGRTPEGEASTVEIMKAWNRGFADRHNSLAGLSS